MESCRMWGEPESGEVESTYTINHSVDVIDEPFECGTQYASLGSDQRTAAFTDFRMFVHNVQLVDDRGVKHLPP